jgi:hypothetical protein
MIAKLLSINLNAKKRSEGGKTYTGVEVTYQGQPYKGQEKEPTTRFLFSNNPVAEALASYKPGQMVEIKFDTDKWKTPISISLADDAAPKSSPSSSGSSSGGGRYGQQDESTQKRIARSVAIKESTILVMEMMKQGAFAASKTKSYEFLAQQVLEVAKIYEPYLNCTDAPDVVDKPVISAEDFEQDGFDD